MKKGFVLMAFTMVSLSMFSGSAAAQWTVTNLHPAGAYTSAAYGVSGGQQVGVAEADMGLPHASLWSGTAASWVDLNPDGATVSYAYGVSGGRQVGSALLGGYYHASLWSGTAASWVDLHALLPPSYLGSTARGIDVSGSEIWIVGDAYNGDLERNEAILWHNVIPEPSSLLALGMGLPAILLGLKRRRD